MKNRYITITPPQVIVDGAPTAQSIQVTVAAMPRDAERVGEVWWAGPPQIIPNSPNIDLVGAQLVCDPSVVHAEDWPVERLHLFGEAIVPGARYEVRMCDAAGSICSDPLIVDTAAWGDVVAPFGGASQPNFGDISAIVTKFQESVGSPDVTRADLIGSSAAGAPDIANRIVNFADVNAGVGAFQGQVYPFAVGACPAP